MSATRSIDINEVLARTSLPAIISRKVSLKRVGRLLKGCCPFHGEKTPSFTVYPDHFHCYGCGAHGNAIDFVERTTGATFVEALQQMAAEVGLVDRRAETASQRAKRERIEREQARREAARVAKEARDRDRYAGWVGKRVRRAVTVADTLGERYLLETRSIPCPVDGWPDAIRFDAHAQALVAVATNADGRITGGQWIHLTPDATKTAETLDRPTKKTLGEIRGAAVRLPGRSGSPLQVAEGPETGLSVWLATGHETWIALGGLANLPTPPIGRDVVACCDDDPRHSAAARRARDTIARWRRAGVSVCVAKPWEIRREDRSDFNDLLQAGGTGAIERRIIEALEPLFFTAGASDDTPPAKRAPKPPADTLHIAAADIRRPDIQPIPVEIGRIRMERLIDADAQRAIAAPPDGPAWTHAIGAGAGGGKTRMVHDAAVQAVTEMRARGDDRTIVIGTPRHSLNDEQIERLAALHRDIRVADYGALAGERIEQIEDWMIRAQARPSAQPADLAETDPPPALRLRPWLAEQHRTARASLPHRSKPVPNWIAEQIEHLDAGPAPDGIEPLPPDITVAAWRGADADNPDRPGEKMCRNPNDRREAEARQLDPRKTVCPACPFREGCAKLAQDDMRADIWAVPNHILFGRKPAALGTIAWLVLDENPLAAAVFGAGDPASDSTDKPVLLTLDELREPHEIPGDQEQTDRLHEIRGWELAALEQVENGRVSRAALLSTKLTVEMLEAAVRLEYATKIEPPITRGMSRQDRLEALREADANRTLGRRVMIHQMLADLLRHKGRQESGNVELVTFKEQAGSVAAVSMKGCRQVKAGWQVPTTVIDATLQPDLLRAIWPHLRADRIAQFDAPHRHVRQCRDKAFSLSSLDIDSVYIDEKERKRRRANVKLLHLTIMREVRRVAPGQVLVVAQKRIRVRLEEIGGLGPNVDFAHHGAVTGIDKWRDVRLVIVVGRTQPPPAAAERLAEALTGVPVLRLEKGKWYGRRDATHLMTGGDLVSTESDFHPDPIAEAFRWRACEGELIQIIERARGVNRLSDDERADVLLLTDVPLPVPVDDLFIADAVAPRIEDRMLAAGGIAYQGAEAAATAYRDVWPSAGTLRVARHREKERYGGYWQPHSWLETWRFRRDAPGARYEHAYVDRSMVADPVAALTERHGKLAVCAQIAPLHPPSKPSSKGHVTQHPGAQMDAQQGHSAPAGGATTAASGIDGSGDTGACSAASAADAERRAILEAFLRQPLPRTTRQRTRPARQ